MQNAERSKKLIRVEQKNIYVVPLPVWDNIIRKDTQKKLHLYVLFVIKNMNVSKVKLITIKLVEILSVEKK